MGPLGGRDAGEPLGLLTRVAGVDAFSGAGDAFAEIRGLLGDDEGGGGVEKDGVAVGRGLAGKERAQGAAVLDGRAAEYRGERMSGEAAVRAVLDQNNRLVRGILVREGLITVGTISGGRIGGAPPLEPILVTH